MVRSAQILGANATEPKIFMTVPRIFGILFWWFYILLFSQTQYFPLMEKKSIHYLSCLMTLPYAKITNVQ
jgi:hypothetical protein